jgi:hypothetical protein
MRTLRSEKVDPGSLNREAGLIFNDTRDNSLFCLRSKGKRLREDQQYQQGWYPSLGFHGTSAHQAAHGHGLFPSHFNPWIGVAPR